MYDQQKLRQRSERLVYWRAKLGEVRTERAETSRFAGRLAMGFKQVAVVVAGTSANGRFRIAAERVLGAQPVPNVNPGESGMFLRLGDKTVHTVELAYDVLRGAVAAAQDQLPSAATLQSS